MIRIGSCATGLGSITSWYPDVDNPFHVLSVEFWREFADYHLFDYRQGRTILRFRIFNNGERLDTQ